MTSPCMLLPVPPPPDGRPLPVWVEWIRRHQAAPRPEQIANLLASILIQIEDHGSPVAVETLWIARDGRIAIHPTWRSLASTKADFYRCLCDLARIMCELWGHIAIPVHTPSCSILNRIRGRVAARMDTWDASLAFVLDGMLGANRQPYSSIGAVLADLNDLFRPSHMDSFDDETAVQRMSVHSWRLPHPAPPPPPAFTIPSFLKPASIAFGTTLATAVACVSIYYLGQNSSRPRVTLDLETIRQIQQLAPAQVPAMVSAPAPPPPQETPRPLERPVVPSKPSSVPKARIDSRSFSSPRIQRESLENEPEFVPGAAPLGTGMAVERVDGSGAFVARVEPRRR